MMMMSQEARELFRRGEMREAITQYRQALRFETDAFERALIYVDLARIYRIRVRMQNAHLELQRAFKEIGLEWPKNTPWALIKAIFTQYAWPKLCDDFERRPLEQRTQLVSDLLQEVGLSAYYVRETWTLIQSTFRSRKPAHDLGPSRALLTWYGGTACVLAIVDLITKTRFFRSRAQRYLEMSQQIAQQLNTPRNLGECLVWAALVADYQGDPVRSAELFEQVLHRYGTHMDPFDVRLSAITLSLNYLSRGHFQKSINAFKKQGQCAPSLEASLEGHLMDDVPWYTLGSQAMLGEIKDIQPITRLFSSILSANNDEKWLLAQYLGHLLIAGRKIGMNYSHVDDLVSRFGLLGMTPRGTHSETGFYWVAVAYMRWSLAQKDKTLTGAFKESLRCLGQVLPHPTIHSHYAVLQAALAWLEANPHAYQRWFAKAWNEAQAIDNQWALMELTQLRTLSASPDLKGPRLEIQ